MKISNNRPGKFLLFCITADVLQIWVIRRQFATIALTATLALRRYLQISSLSTRTFGYSCPSTFKYQWWIDRNKIETIKLSIVISMSFGVIKLKLRAQINTSFKKKRSFWIFLIKLNSKETLPKSLKIKISII